MFFIIKQEVFHVVKTDDFKTPEEKVMRLREAKQQVVDRTKDFDAQYWNLMEEVGCEDADDARIAWRMWESKQRLSKEDFTDTRGRDATDEEKAAFDSK